MSVAALATKTATPAVPVTPPVPLERIYLLSAEQYDRMAEVGILGPDTHTELIEGWIVRKMTLNPPHVQAVMRLTKRLSQYLGNDWELLVQGPIALPRSRPEPDVALIRGPDTRYTHRHARPSEIGLLIEVGDSSFLSERQFKVPLYAAAKIAEVWLVNLVEDHVAVYTQPRGGKSPAYRQRREYRPGEEVPLVLEGKEIARCPSPTSVCWKIDRRTRHFL